MADELDIAELRELLAKATKGEWKVWHSTIAAYVRVMGGNIAQIDIPYDQWTDEYRKHPIAKDNARFIAAAHNAFPALLDAADEGRATIEAAQAERDAWRQELAEIEDQRDRLRKENDRARAILAHIETYHPQALENARAALTNTATNGERR